MRAAFAKTIMELAERDPRVLLLTGDLGYTVLESFSQRFPDRFFNVGVAEQNMVGLATGLAEAGYIPYVYSIATFVSLRPYEFIRNGPVLHRLPVRIVGIGGGFEYGHNGASHFGLEDVGVLRLQPGMTVLAPADHEQARAAMLATWNLTGPVYYRLGKDDHATVAGLGGRFELGRAHVVREGNDLLFIVMGSIAGEAVAACEALAQQGIQCTLVTVASLNPPPVQDLVRLLTDCPIAVTVEAHYVVGGLGSLVSEVIAEHGLGTRLKRCGVRETPDGRSGEQSYHYRKHHLARENLVDEALAMLRSVRS